MKFARALLFFVFPFSLNATQAQDNPPLVIALAGGQNVHANLEAHECLRELISETLQIESVLLAPAIRDINEGMSRGAIDVAWTSNWSYAWLEVHWPGTYEPVLMSLNEDGQWGFYSIAIARKDHGFTSLSEFAGKIFTFGSNRSQTGYHIPNLELPEALPDTHSDLWSFFSDVQYSKGHSETIEKVANQVADVGVVLSYGPTFETAFDRGPLRDAVDEGLINPDDLVEIWRSIPIPIGGVMVRSDLDPSVRRPLIALLKDMQTSHPDCAQSVLGGDENGFREPIPGVWDPMIEVRRSN
ncbi:PhnD/SsuA/transferrin family substrate-binding protein [Roseibium album]|uniref:PhnD/SsuA/transferrin family substrate-binding protein n=1 Tax=Roseibium album TaxID=311410 RepID=UPI0032978609